MFVFRRFFLPRPLSSRLLGKSFLPCPSNLSIFLSYRTTITLFAEVSISSRCGSPYLHFLHASKPGMLLQSAQEVISTSYISGTSSNQKSVETRRISNQTRHRPCANVNRKPISPSTISTHALWNNPGIERFHTYHPCSFSIREFEVVEEIIHILELVGRIVR